MVSVDSLAHLGELGNMGPTRTQLTLMSALPKYLSMA
jgi:hypothetical protein